MTCGECGREHALTGEVFVDGTLIPIAWHEVTVEVLCKHGLLRARPEPVGEAAMVEPDPL